jgi:Macrocin-O-methyltransferase (TylF)
MQIVLGRTSNLASALAMLVAPKRLVSRVLQEIRWRISAHCVAARRGFALLHTPDSVKHFNAHPELCDLYARFSRRNRVNNGQDIGRLWAFVFNIKQVLGEGVPGDFAELGVWRGNTAAILAHFASAHGREVLLFDTFAGFSARDMKGVDAEKPIQFADTSIELAHQTIGEASCCEFVPGYFPDSLTKEHRDRRFAVVSLDCDLQEPMKAGLDFFYPRLNPGGLLLLHDYCSGYWEGCKAAIDAFCAASGEHLIVIPDKSGSAFIRRSLSGPDQATSRR